MNPDIYYIIYIIRPYITNVTTIKDIKNFYNINKKVRLIASSIQFWDVIFYKHDVPIYDYDTEKLELNPDVWLHKLYYGNIASCMATLLIHRCTNLDLMTVTIDPSDIIFLYMKNVTYNKYALPTMIDVIEAPIIFKMDTIEITTFTTDRFRLRVRLNGNYYNRVRIYNTEQLLLFLTRILYLNYVKEINFKPYSKEQIDIYNTTHVEQSSYRHFIDQNTTWIIGQNSEIVGFKYPEENVLNITMITSGF